MLVASVAAQTQPYPSTSAPMAPWGGYAVPAAVPYQPTLDTVVSDAHPWQPTPTVSGVVPAGEVAFPDQIAPASRKPWFPPGGRDGFFQKLEFTGGFLPRYDLDGLGVSEMNLGASFGLPFVTRDTPLLITPYYGVRFTDGPVMPDVPPRLHDAAVKLENVRPLSDQWLALFRLELGQYADDKSFDASDAFRITGGGAAIYRPSDTWRIILGAEYIDRAEAAVLPIAGVIYTPSDDVEYKLVFPEPKISWRLPWTDMPGQDERWAYVGAEYGGGIWAIERTSGAADELDITEYRIFVGYERKIVGGLSRRIEIGYVFGRDLQYASTPGEVALDDTLMVRGGITY